MRRKGFGAEGCTLDLGLDIVDGIGGLDLKGDGLAREGLDKNLHCGLVEVVSTPASDR